jgi:RNA polymerase-binding transcription factor DksA
MAPGRPVHFASSIAISVLLIVIVTSAVFISAHWRTAEVVEADWTSRIAASEMRLRQLASQEAPAATMTTAISELRTDGDEGDIAQVVIDGEIAQRVADLRASLQEQLARAIDRLELGGYGYCEDCGGTIPAERMEFAPETTTCVTCQGRRDRRH